MKRAILMLFATLALVLSGAAVASATSHAKRVGFVDGTYQLYGTDGDCGNAPCGMHYTATEDGNNVAYRAVMECANGNDEFGGWKTGHNTSNTAECGPGSGGGSFAFIEVNMQLQDISGCWTPGGLWHNACGGN